MADQTVYSVALRPKRLSEVIGQPSLVTGIKSQIASGRVPKAWLFAGDSGGGKTTLARIVAVSLQMESWDDFGEPTDEMYDSKSYDIHELNAAKENKVEDIEPLIETSRFRPTAGSKYKVLILDEAHRITTQAQQLLLKPTEDAPGKTIWMFCTTEPAKLSATLRRRCVEFNVSQLDNKGIKTLLGRAHKHAPVENMRAFFDAACKAEHVPKTPGMILKALEGFSARGGDPASYFQPEGMTCDAFAIAQAVTRGNWSAVAAEIKKQDGGKLSLDQARMVRVVVAGYIRSGLMKPWGDPLAHYEAIQELAGTARVFDDSLLPSTIVAALYAATAGYKKK